MAPMDVTRERKMDMAVMFDCFAQISDWTLLLERARVLYRDSFSALTACVGFPYKLAVFPKCSRRPLERTMSDSMDGVSGGPR